MKHVEADVLVSFFDLTNFTRTARNIPPLDLIRTMDAFFEFAGETIRAGGGRLVKVMGDAGLVVFPEDRADAGVRALLEFAERGDAWCAARGLPCRVIVKVHFGPVACGPVGAAGEKRFDVYGSNVNLAATLPSHGFAITPEAFRRLSPETRRLFKKHTPSVRYIPIGETHRD